MSGKSKLTDQDREEIRRLRKEGARNAALAAQFDVSVTTIIRVCRPDLYDKNLESNRKSNKLNSEKINEARKSSLKRYSLQFHVKTDAEIIDHLDRQDNTTGYVRDLIRRDICKMTEQEMFVRSIIEKK